MIDDLPELGDIFNGHYSEKKEVKHQRLQEDFDDKNILISISKEKGEWLSVSFIDIAPSGIGLHVLLPVKMEFHADELDKVRVKFERIKNNSKTLLKEVPVLVRWHEKDSMSGKIKIGLHFHGKVKSEPIIIDILKKLKSQ